MKNAAAQKQSFPTRRVTASMQQSPVSVLLPEFPRNDTKKSRATPEKWKVKILRQATRDGRPVGGINSIHE